MDGIERPKRQKRDTLGKAGAFERLKQLKTAGVKHKYEIKPIEDVYEEISEKEYTEKVLKRQQDSWIVDDNLANGYIEDGREIFDDDIDDDSLQTGGVSKKRNRAGKHKSTEQGAKSSNSIQKMFSKMPMKKKLNNLMEDDILGSLMKELDTPSCNVIEEPGLRKKNLPTELNTSDSLFTESANSSCSVLKELDNSGYNLFNDCDTSTETYTKEFNVGIKSGLDPSTSIDTCDDTFSSIHNFSNEVFINNSITKVELNAENDKVEDCVVSKDQTCEVVNDGSLINIALPVFQDGMESMRFFYLDAYEDIYNQPGVVFMFGKMWLESSKMYISCCVVVKNIERCIFLLPRESVKKEPVKILDVYNEFNDKIAMNYKIKKFKSRKMNKKYAFNIADVPDACDYLEVRYSASDPPLPSSLTGETFSRVFGTNTSFLELFLLERRIKGPCWLQVKNFETVSNPVTWCKLEVNCGNSGDITLVNDSNLTPPALIVMTIKMHTMLCNKTNDNQIVMIAGVVNNYLASKSSTSPPYSEQQFCTYTRPSDMSWPYDLNDILNKPASTNLVKMDSEHASTNLVKMDSEHASTNLVKTDSERTLLGFFLAKLYKIDPDLIIGHDIYGFDIGTLLQRFISNKIPHWSRLGRIRRTHIPHGKNRTFWERNVVSGRLICDLKISAKELIKSRSYDLDTLCQQVFNISEDQRISLNSADIKQMYNTSCNLMTLIDLTIRDAKDIFRIFHELNILPLSVQITNIAGNILSRTLTGGRSERNEFLLLHAFIEKNYILPDKIYSKKQFNPDVELQQNAKQKRARKPQYEGGLVLEPKKGFYDKFILLMDFNSLYPSIIQEYNICFTTIPIRLLSVEEGEETTLLNHMSMMQPGILPSEIRKLVESRRDIKRMMQNPDIAADIKYQYNIRQLALKLTANSMYGCLGFSNSRFYAKPLAALITGKGREILLSTRDLVRKLNYDVIYGDTDSLMINTNCVDYDHVLNVGQKIKHEVNRKYKHIELEIDGVFKYMLLLKKKKYAAVTVNKLPNGELVTKQEIKGLDIIRRDWSLISAEVGKLILTHILSEKSIDEKIEKISAELLKIKTQLESMSIPLSMLAITKQLNKNPEEYPDKKSLPHVQVAFRLNTTTTTFKKLKKGDTVPYVICDDGSNLPSTQRAYHTHELNTNENLKIDVKYYLSQQIHPVVSRLCEPIVGIDSAQIAECLGLDTTMYVRSKCYGLDNQDTEDVDLINDEDKYDHCDKFSFKCVNEQCGKLITIDSAVIKKGNTFVLSLERCINDQCSVLITQYLPNIQNHLTIAIRGYIQKYYRAPMICEDKTCSNNTRRLSLKCKNGLSVCNLCHKNVLRREYSEKQLYDQLTYFQYLFDITNVLQSHKSLKVHHESEIFIAYCRLKERVESILKYNAYRVINFGTFYGSLKTNKTMQFKFL